MKATPTPETLDSLLAAFGTSVSALSARTGIPPIRIRYIYCSGTINQGEVQCVLNAFGQAAFNLLQAMQIGGINQGGFGNAQFTNIENLNIHLNFPPPADPLSDEEQTKALVNPPQRWNANQILPGSQPRQIGQHVAFRELGHAA